MNIIQEILSKLNEFESKTRQTNTNSSDYGDKRKYEYAPYHFRNLFDLLLELDNTSRSDSLLVSNTGALLLDGDAGNGKTHLFCDIAEKRVQNKQPTI